MMKKIFLILALFSFNSIFSFSQKKVQVNGDILLNHLEDSVFIHTSYHHSEKFGRFPSNGLVIVKNGEGVLIDTPMDNEKTKELLDFLEEEMGIEIKKFVPGHYHNDCIGGIDYLHSIGVKSIANEITIDKCKENNLTIPQVSFEGSKTISFNGKEVVFNYFGGGHTIDNIVVWIPDNKILFGGCLVKSMSSKGLGNLADAVVEEWGATIQEVLNSYPNLQYVIPGHGKYGDKALLEHTIKLVKNLKMNINEKSN